MASLNKCMFIGNLGRDPELKYAQSGKAILNASIAVNSKRQGEEHTEWVNLVFFDKVAEIVDEYARKGDPIFVEGRMQTRKWTDRDGAERYSTEIVVDQLQLLGGRRDGGRDEGRGRDDDRTQRQERPAATRDSRPSRAPAPAAPRGGQTGFDDMDDDIPF